MRAFLEAHAAVILRLARGVMRERGDRVEPEDVAQEVIAQLIRLHLAGTFDPAVIANPEAYLRVAVRNAAHRARTRRGTLERVASDGDVTSVADDLRRVDVDSPPTPEEATEHALDRRRAIETIKARLRPRDAAVFALLVEEGLDIDEVAGRLGTSANNVYQIRHRILTAARQFAQEKAAETSQSDARSKELPSESIDSQKGSP
jgi:RNA polymerase sigma factor (sigma-70 family)